MLTSLIAAMYIGASANGLLPQGGSPLAAGAGAALRAGAYLTDDAAAEGELGWTRGAYGFGAQGLFHFQGWGLYNRFFGYSRFDPFLTLGARGWLAEHGHGQIGPKAGLGAFYHLTDDWSLRADADATLGLDTETEMVYSLSVGVQYEF